MEFQYDSYCGIYCGSCFVLCAYTQNRIDIVPEQWKERIKGMKLQCHGCKSQDVFENCKGCTRRPCAQAKGYDYCFQCPEYPCEIYTISKEKYNLAHHNVAQIRFKILQEKGCQEWLKYQENRWKCPKCGETFSWYEKTCFNCGNPVLDSITEEQQINNQR